MDMSIMIDMTEKPRRSVIDDQEGDNRAQSVYKKGILIQHSLKERESDKSTEDKA